FTAPSPSQIYTLSLHDALPISEAHRLSSCIFGRRLSGSSFSSCLYDGKSGGNDCALRQSDQPIDGCKLADDGYAEYSHFYLRRLDRKSTRLNSSHVSISYAVFC